MYGKLSSKIIAAGPFPNNLLFLFLLTRQKVQINSNSQTKNGHYDVHGFVFDFVGSAAV